VPPLSIPNKYFFSIVCELLSFINALNAQG